MRPFLPLCYYASIVAENSRLVNSSLLMPIMPSFLSRYRTHAVLGGLAVPALALWGLALSLPDPNTLEVYFLDVGQGDSALTLVSQYNNRASSYSR